jgi:hypothetical protein
MEEVLALQEDPGSAQLLREPFREVERCRPAREVVEQVRQLAAEGAGAPRLIVGAGELVQRPP